VFPRPLELSSAWGVVRAVLGSPSCHLLVETDRHPEILDELVASDPDVAGNLVHDLHTVALMREHGVREIRTRDADFRRFSDLRVVDPLA
jgi:predicted nucleic acid-binding protein